MRPMLEQDLEACCALCLQIAKIDRVNELPHKLPHGLVAVDCKQQIVGYSVGLNFGAHTVASSALAVKSLVCAQESESPFLVPASQAGLAQWLMNERGGRLIKTLCLMCCGDYESPDSTGVYFPTADF